MKSFLTSVAFLFALLLSLAAPSYAAPFVSDPTTDTTKASTVTRETLATSLAERANLTRLSEGDYIKAKQAAKRAQQAQAAAQQPEASNPVLKQYSAKQKQRYARRAARRYLDQELAAQLLPTPVYASK